MVGNVERSVVQSRLATLSSWDVPAFFVWVNEVNANARQVMHPFSWTNIHRLRDLCNIHVYNLTFISGDS